MESIPIKNLINFTKENGICLTLGEIDEMVKLLGIERGVPNFKANYYLDSSMDGYDDFLPEIEGKLEYEEVFDYNRELKIYCVDNKELWFLSSDGKAEESCILFIK